MAWLSRLGVVLAHPRFPWLAALLGVLLALPSVGQGLLLDDHLHRIYVEAVAQGRAPGAWWDLYAVSSGEVADNQAAMELGAMPWWSLPELRVRFLRPLSAATHHLDHRLWPGAPWLMHVHSLAWYAALVIAAGALLRRWLGVGWVAGLGTLLLAVDDAHALPVAWLAQRNALVSATLLVLALLAHDRWRRDAWRPGAWLGPVAYAAALLAGEAAVAGLGFLLAHAAWLDPATARGPDRSVGTRGLAAVRVLLPFVVITLAWRGLYDALGYGAFGSGTYLDPSREPAAFLAALPDRAAALLLGQLAGPSADTWLGVPSPWTMARVGAVAVVAVSSLASWSRLRAEPGLRVVVVGSLLAVIPAATAVPSDRLLLLVGLGSCAALASIVGTALRPASSGPRLATLLCRLLALPVVVWHLGAAAAGMVQTIRQLPQQLDASPRAIAASLPADAALAGQQLVVVNAPPTFIGAMLWVLRTEDGATLPAGLRVLGSTFAPVVVKRPDAHTLVLQPIGGYLGDPFTALVRGPQHPLRAGDRIALAGWDVEVTGVANGRPTVVTVRFDEPLDAPSLRFITWRGDGFAPFSLPPVGGATVSPGQAPAPAR